MCDPVRKNMIGLPGHQDTHIDAASGSSFQSIEQDMIRNKVGIREQNNTLGLVDGLDIHITNREGQVLRIIAMQNDKRIKFTVVMTCDTVMLSSRAEAIPEIDKRLCKLGGSWPMYTQMGI